MSLDGVKNEITRLQTEIEQVVDEIREVVQNIHFCQLNLKEFALKKHEERNEPTHGPLFWMSEQDIRKALDRLYEEGTQLRTRENHLRSEKDRWLNAEQELRAQNSNRQQGLAPFPLLGSRFVLLCQGEHVWKHVKPRVKHLPPQKNTIPAPFGTSPSE